MRSRTFQTLILFALTAGIAGLNPIAVHAQEYPTAPIRFVIGFPPGTTADISARVIGARMSQILGQQILVENRSGAGSSIAAAAVARAPKDGYTLLICSSANVMNAAMNPNLNFDFYKDFAPVALVTSAPTVLVVTPELGVKTVQELITLARSKRDGLSFGSSGVGSTTHLALELFTSLAGVKITHVPYPGSPQVVADLLAGRIHGYFSPASTVMGQVRAGKLVALAVTDAKRNPTIPDLPTMIEAGVPNFESVLWFGIVAPAGTPQPVIDKLSRAANEALNAEDIAKALHAQTISVIGSTPEAFRQHIDSENKRWTAVIVGAGLGK